MIYLYNFISVEKCSAEKIWFLSRHGTRYPNEFTLANDASIIANEIVNNHNKGRGEFQVKITTFFILIKPKY